jgi:hypothetical protein
MVTESATPKFTAPAARIWNAISPVDQQTLVSRSWCSNCRQEVTIADYSGSIKAGLVLLQGTCSACGGTAYRFVETKLSEGKSLTVVFGKSKLTWNDALAEGELAQKESKLLQKRLRQLDRKSEDGTITKAEERELKLISKKGMNEVIMKMHAAACQLTDSIEI